MKAFASLALLLMAGNAFALPNPPQPAPNCQGIVDDYDNLPSGALVPQTNKIGTYHGLTYNGFVVSTPGPLAAYVPHSSKSVAAATMLQDVLLLGAITLNPFGTIVAAPGTKSFDLKCFYFSCTLDLQENAASVAEGCTLAVTGFNVDNKQIPVATFAFSPTRLMQNSMILAELPPTYVNLKNITMGIAVADVVGASQAILDLDDLTHRNNV